MALPEVIVVHEFPLSVEICRFDTEKWSLFSAKVSDDRLDVPSTNTLPPDLEIVPGASPLVNIRPTDDWVTVIDWVTCGLPSVVLTTIDSVRSDRPVHAGALIDRGVVPAAPDVGATVLHFGADVGAGVGSFAIILFFNV
jgi:hypothetical protein